MDNRLLVTRYGGRVPRYTSYPTAPHFRAVAGDDWYREWLQRYPGHGPASLYIHVPFCQAMCWYCGCHTRVAKDEAPVHAYVAALRREIALTAEAIGRRIPVARIHWGGGTPTLLDPKSFAAIWEDLKRFFDLDAMREHAVEVDPRTLSDDRVEMLSAAGVTRVSLGVQTLSEEVQTRINRIQPIEQIESAVERLRRAGITAVNVDLMYGLPAQTTFDVAFAATAVAGLASRVALFGYAHVPWMKPHQTRIDETELPDALARFGQLIMGSAILENAGYRRIGLDHFALPDDPLALAAADGRLRRNFQGYTDDQSSVLLGFGASAIGESPDGYVQNMTAIPDWQRMIFAGKLPVAKMRALSPEDRLRRGVIQALMCGESVDLDQLLPGHGYSADHLDGALRRLADPVRHGLVTMRGRQIEVARDAWPFLRSIAAAFDAYLAPDESRHAQAI